MLKNSIKIYFSLIVMYVGLLEVDFFTLLISLMIYVDMDIFI